MSSEVDGLEGGGVPTRVTAFVRQGVERFDLSRTDDVLLKIYNVLGQEISTLAQGQYQPGRHEIGFEAANLPAGVYPYVLRIGGRVLTKKMLVVD